MANIPYIGSKGNLKMNVILVRYNYIMVNMSFPRLSQSDLCSTPVLVSCSVYQFYRLLIVMYSISVESVI